MLIDRRWAYRTFKAKAPQTLTVLIWFLALLPCWSLHAADEELPQDVRGFWVTTREMCDNLKTVSPADVQKKDQRWLKITATDVLGTTQARLLRRIPPQKEGGIPALFSFEIQIADTFGLIGQLNFRRPDSLKETIVGAHMSRYYVKC
jgi:hypothetical protein